MKIEYRLLGRIILAGNLLLTFFVIYIAIEFASGEEQANDSALFAPVTPVENKKAERKSVFRDYSVITADRFISKHGTLQSDASMIVPVPGPSSMLDRLIKLRGTAVSSDSGMSCAIIELLQNGESRTVTINDEIAGAVVLDIGENSILVSMDNEEIRVSLDATEEYGAKARKNVGARGGKQAARPMRTNSAMNAGGQLPPGIQQYLKQLPPEVRKKWDNASPEDKQKFIKRFMDRANQGGAKGAQGINRDVRKRK